MIIFMLIVCYCPKYMNYTNKKKFTKNNNKKKHEFYYYI